MVVMETVRAATLASSRKKDRLMAELAMPTPLAASSPNEKRTKPIDDPYPVRDFPPSPVISGNTGSLPEELIRYRNQTYVAPEKLQIVKPLEGSVTLLKWKLLATPQLGGATSFFSDASRPGVHMKKWKAGGVVDEDRPTGLVGTKIKSLSTNDISSLEHFMSYSKPEDASKRESLPIVDQQKQGHKTNSPTITKQKTNKNESKNFFSQVTSFIGSGWSNLGFKGKVSQTSSLDTQKAVQDDTNSSVAGLASLLDS